MKLIKVVKKDGGFPSRAAFEKFEKRIAATVKEFKNSDVRFQVLFRPKYDTRTIDVQIVQEGRVLTIQNFEEGIAGAKQLNSMLKDVRGTLEKAISYAEKLRADLEKELKNLQYEE